MKVTCANCGEELLGAVNRCWRCGTSVATTAVVVDLPPVRRAPPALQTQVTATDDQPGAVADRAGEQRVEDDTSIAAQLPTPNAVPDQPPVLAAPTLSDHPEVADDFIPLAELRDNPASNAAPPTPPPAAASRDPKITPGRSAYSANTGGAIASLCLGGMSLLISYFTPLAIVPAVVGLAMGIWGLYSTRRGMAFAGVALCCIALAISGFNGLVDLYTYRYGHAPWDAPEEFEIYDDVYFEEKGDL